MFLEPDEVMICGVTVPELLSKQFNTDLRKTPTLRANTRNHISAEVLVQSERVSEKVMNMLSL